MKKIQRFTKILAIGLSCVLGVCLLAGCGNGAQNGATNDPNSEDAWYAGYSLETEKISVWGFDEGKVLFEVTNPDDIKFALNVIDFASWRIVESEGEQLTGMPSYYLDFNNGTAFNIYGDLAYGEIGTKVESYTSNDHTTPSLVNGNGKYYNMPDQLLKAVQNLVAKYAPEALPENSTN
ncbi:MAG: hypothetical protein ACOX05_03610 [Bacillota bacterium]|jgi:hypothetical protein